MKSQIRDRGDVRIIELSGKITIGSGDVKIRELIDGALEEGKNRMLLDLGGVSTIDSSGIGEMVACYTTVTKNDGQLKLMRLSPKINDILQVPQLITVFDAQDEHEEAAFVAEAIAKLQDESMNLSDIAVFYRTNAQSRVIEELFVRFGITYQVVGGVKYYDRKEVKDMVRAQQREARKRLSAETMQLIQEQPAKAWANLMRINDEILVENTYDIAYARSRLNRLL